MQQEYSEALSSALCNQLPLGAELGWEHIAESITATASNFPGYATRKEKDWFDANIPDMKLLLDNKHKTHAALLSNPSSARLSEE